MSPLARQRAVKEAIGFYLFHLFLVILLSGLAAGILAATGLVSSFQAGMGIGEAVAAMYALVLTFLVVRAKGLHGHPGYVLLAIAAGFGGLILGGLLGVIPAAFVSTRAGR